MWHHGISVCSSVRLVLKSFLILGYMLKDHFVAENIQMNIRLINFNIFWLWYVLQMTKSCSDRLMISWTVSWKLPTVNQPLINSPRRREFMFPSVSECHQSLSEFDVWFFSTWLRGHRLDRTRYWPISNIVCEGFDKCEVIPDRHGPTKLKRVFCQDYQIFSLNVCFITRWPAIVIWKWRLTLLLQFGWSLDWHSHLWVYCLLSSMQFCDSSNVSDLIFQCASSHVDFQVLQFYVINCYNP